MVAILRQRWQKRFVIAAVTTIALGLIMVILYLLPTIHDPTEDTFSIYIVNDMSGPVLLELCESDNCKRVVDRQPLSGGGDSVSVNVAPKTEQRYIVKLEDSHTSQCRVLVINRIVPDKHFTISSLPLC